jgi:pyruvate kinase
MRKAKIICTIGPASESSSVVSGLIRAGMDVARLNFSHGTHEEHGRRIELIRRLAKKLSRSVAILQDVQGPKWRLGSFQGGRLTVRAGQRVTLTTRQVVGRDSVIPVPIRSLPREVKPGDPILLDDGRVQLEVIRSSGPDILSQVRVGGVLSDHKGINLPNSHLSLNCITEKDEKDIRFGQKMGVDYLALSFVRTAKDVERARPLVQRLGTPLIAKIEKPQAVANFTEIADAADGVMIARGDLGVEMPLEKLPGIQKNAITTANRLGRIIIVATEMLESMTHSVRPTRAEVSDVANAILDGTDAVMLSAETAVGEYPVQSAATMARIVVEAERRGPPRPPPEPSGEISRGVAAAAVVAAAQMKIDALVAYTESGYTARLISQLRPSANILALTPNPEVVRRMSLYWGVQGQWVPRVRSTDAMLRQVKQISRRDRICRPGSSVVIVAGVPLNIPGNTNLVTIHRV